MSANNKGPINSAAASKSPISKPPPTWQAPGKAVANPVASAKPIGATPTKPAVGAKVGATATPPPTKPTPPSGSPTPANSPQKPPAGAVKTPFLPKPATGAAKPAAPAKKWTPPPGHATTTRPAPKPAIAPVRRAPAPPPDVVKASTTNEKSLPDTADRQKFWEQQAAEEAAAKKSPQNKSTELPSNQSASSLKNRFEQAAQDAAPAKPQLQSTGKKWTPPPTKDNSANPPPSAAAPARWKVPTTSHAPIHASETAPLNAPTTKPAPATAALQHDETIDEGIEQRTDYQNATDSTTDLGERLEAVGNMLGKLNFDPNATSSDQSWWSATGVAPDLDFVIQAVASGQDLNEQNPDGAMMTALHFAVISENAEILQYLLDSGAHPDVPDEGGLTPLHHAIVRGNLDATRRLVNAGADVNYLGGGERPLRRASSAVDWSVATVAFLVRKGATVNPEDPEEATALDLALQMGHVASAAFLLLYAAERRSNGGGFGGDSGSEDGDMYAEEFAKAQELADRISTGADFANVDAEGKGHVTKDDLLNSGLPEEMVDILFPLFDEDDNGILDRDEFNALNLTFIEFDEGGDEF